MMKEFGRIEISIVNDRNIPKRKVIVVGKDRIFGYLKPI